MAIDSGLVVLTGGGTAGHVNPNLALVPALRSRGWQVAYIGSGQGIEAELVSKAGIPFYGISAGKLRRYWSWQNFVDPFKVLKGISDAYGLLGKLKPQVIFSKGGFVTVPVLWSGWLRGIPTIIHESDLTPGLANRLSLPFASKVCVSFPQTLNYLGRWGHKAVCTGLPIRAEILGGGADRGRAIFGFSNDRPVLLVVGGSTGSVAINRAVRAILPQLRQQFQILHLCGRGNQDSSLNYPDYQQREYVTTELGDALAMADIVVSRAGANAIFELLALQKPHLLIPLPAQSSRGDQILNAQAFAELGYSMVLLEAYLTPDALLQHIQLLYTSRHKYTEKMQTNVTVPNRSIEQITDIMAAFMG
jgi:UDP-N-acetylglucosamine--N-acetylmuramyl-(pentapeptide) pyrophosphoryl-undecaprenol N-acetylglucosamine transferase